MKLPGVSPLKSSAVSLDLLNLYVVHQISTKKENAENIRKPIHVDINRETKIPLRKQNVEFPKSPECRPTKLSLDDIQQRIQEEILDSRRKYLYEKASVPSEDLGSTQTINNKEEDFWFSTTAYRSEEFNVPDPDAPAGLYFQQLNSRRKGHSDPSRDYSKIFEHEMLDKDFDQHWKQSRQNEDDSQWNSQSPTYSPKQADGQTSSSSDESKAEEWNEEASSESSFSRPSSDPYWGSGRQSSEYVCLFDGRPRSSAAIQLQAKSAVIPKKNTWRRARLQLLDPNDKGTHDASSQTEAFAEPGEKCNAAVQCDIIRGCNCTKELSFTHSAEIVTSTSKVETAGGQNAPAESAVLQPAKRNALLIKNLSPEAACFTVARSA